MSTAIEIDVASTRYLTVPRARIVVQRDHRGQLVSLDYQPTARHLRHLEQATAPAFAVLAGVAYLVLNGNWLLAGTSIGVVLLLGRAAAVMQHSRRQPLRLTSTQLAHGGEELVAVCEKAMRSAPFLGWWHAVRAGVAIEEAISVANRDGSIPQAYLHELRNLLFEASPLRWPGRDLGTVQPAAAYDTTASAHHEGQTRHD